MAGFTLLCSTFFTFTALVTASIGAPPLRDGGAGAPSSSTIVAQQVLGPQTAAAPGRAGKRLRPYPRIAWRNSRSVGQPFAGSLVKGTKLPVEGPDFVTWDPERNRVPSPAGRRYGTDRLIRVLVRVAGEFARTHPHAPRLVIGDLSRPGGGQFGGHSGELHASHQSGLDADVYYPRRDRRERAPRKVSDVDRALSRDLVARFVRAGARYVFVGPRTRLSGPRGVVMRWPNHDNHMHVRLRRG